MIDAPPTPVTPGLTEAVMISDRRRGPRGTQPEEIVKADVLTRLGSRSDVRLFKTPRFKGEAITSRGDRVHQKTMRTVWLDIGADGQPDLSGWVKINGIAVVLEVETKSKDGRLEESQKWRQEMVAAFGGIYIVARSADEAEKQLNYEIDRVRNAMMLVNE